MMIFNPTNVEAQATSGELEKQGEAQAGAGEFAALLSVFFAPIPVNTAVPATGAQITPALESGDGEVDKIECYPPLSMTFNPPPAPTETQFDGVPADGPELKFFTPITKPRGIPADFLNQSVNGFLPPASRHEGQPPTTPAPALNSNHAAPPVTTQPAMTQPAMTQPTTTQPVITQPVTTQLVITQPVTTQTVTTQPMTTQPVTMPPLVPQPVVTKEQTSVEAKAARIIEWQPPIRVNGEARADEKSAPPPKVLAAPRESAGGEQVTETTPPPTETLRVQAEAVRPRTEAMRTRTDGAWRDMISDTSLSAEARPGADSEPEAATVNRFVGESLNDVARHRAAGANETMAQVLIATASTAGDESRLSPAANQSIGATTREVITQTISPLVALAESIQRRESRTIRLRLRPEELGEVELQVTRDAGGRLNVQLSAEREAARDTLANGLGQLRDSLERAGVAVERLEVSAELRFGHGAGGQRHASPERQAAHDLSATIPTHETLNEDGAHAAPNDRLLNLRA